MWQDRDPKKALTLWKIGWLKWLVFLFDDVLIYWERMQSTSFSRLRLLDLKALGSRPKVTMARFWILYKSWRQTRVVGTLLTEKFKKLSTFSTFYTSRKLLFEASQEKNLLIAL